MIVYLLPNMDKTNKTILLVKNKGGGKMGDDEF